MTKQNTRRVKLADRKEWDNSAKALFSLVSSGEAEVIGVRANQSLPERIQAHELSMVQVLSPFHLIEPDANDFRVIELSGPAHIACTTYAGEVEWRERLNDQLYESGRVMASWTHLQVNRAALLRRWPRLSSKVNAESACFEWLLEEMRSSPGKKPKSRHKYFEEGKERFSGLAKRQFVRAWDQAISESGARDWSRPGPTRSDRRAS